MPFAASDVCCFACLLRRIPESLHAFLCEINERQRSEFMSLIFRPSGRLTARTQLGLHCFELVLPSTDLQNIPPQAVEIGICKFGCEMLTKTEFLGNHQMGISIEARHLNDVAVLTSQVFEGAREFFMETYRADQFKAMGLPTD